MTARRVLIIVENLPVPFDRRVWQEARALVGAGYQVCVICPKGDGFTCGFERLEGVAIYRHPLPQAGGVGGYVIEYAWALFWQMLLAVRIAATCGFDVIHACNPPDTIFLIAGVFKLFGKRFVFDHHDLCPELYEVKFGRRGALWRLQRLLEGLTFRTADVVISTNQSYRRVALRRGGVAPDKVFVVRSAPDLNRWPRPKASEAGPALTIGYLGVMGRQEGLDLFLRAFREIVRRRPGVRAVLVGDGPQRAALEAEASALGLAPCVEFTGRLPDPDMQRVLGGVDICVNPDRPSPLNDQSTMNKVLEYMALAKPMVQFESVEGRFSAGSAALYAAPGDVGDFADQVLRLLDDEALRLRMGAEGRRRLENELAWTHQKRALLDAYDCAFAPKGRTIAAADRPIVQA